MEKLSLCILTPSQDENRLTKGYMKTVRTLDQALHSGAWRIGTGEDERLFDLDITLDSHISSADDVVKTRSRLTRLFLERSSADYALWLDDDVDASDDITVIPRMVALAYQFDLGVLAAPYPRKYFKEDVMVRWMRWAIGIEGTSSASPKPPTAPELALAARILEHPLQFAFDQDSFAWLAVKGRAPIAPPQSWLSELAGVGFGCCLTSRACLERMVLHYWEDTRFHDQVLGGKTPGIFRFDRTEDENMGSEDNAFCRRWTALGERVWGYVGQGSPVAHIGSHRFVADRQCMMAPGR